MISDTKGILKIAATLSLTAATLANSATATCTWVQPAHEADHPTNQQETDQ